MRLCVAPNSHIGEVLQQLLPGSAVSCCEAVFYCTHLPFQCPLPPFLCPARRDKWLKGLVHLHRWALWGTVVWMWPLIQEAFKSLVFAKQKGIQDCFRYNWFLSFTLIIKYRQVNLWNCIKWIYFNTVFKGNKF